MADSKIVVVVTPNGCRALPGLLRAFDYLFKGIDGNVGVYSDYEDDTLPEQFLDDEEWLPNEDDDGSYWTGPQLEIGDPDSAVRVYQTQDGVE